MALYHIKDNISSLIFSISIEKDSISSQFMLKSLHSLYKSESRINLTIPPPWRLFLIWCTGMYPSNWNKELWLISLSFAHVSVRQILLKLVFKDLINNSTKGLLLFLYFQLLLFNWLFLYFVQSLQRWSNFSLPEQFLFYLMHKAWLIKALAAITFLLTVSWQDVESRNWWVSVGLIFKLPVSVLSLIHWHLKSLVYFLSKPCYTTHRQLYYRLQIHSETRTWHGKNIQSNAPYK